MKTTIVLAALILAGCALTPTQKKVLIGAGTVLAVGAIAASQSGQHGHKDAGPDVGTPGNPCVTNPQSCR